MARWRGACIQLSAFPTIAEATMKTISRRICGIVLGLGVLGSIVPVVRADDAYSQWQQWREEQRRQQDAQAERERQDERAAWHTWLEGTYRQREEWYEWEAWVSTGGWNSTEAQVVRPAGLVILNPFALEKMAPADQEKVRQQATQSGQQILAEQQIVQNPFVRAAK